MFPDNTLRGTIVCTSDLEVEQASNSELNPSSLTKECGFIIGVTPRAMGTNEEEIVILEKITALCLLCYLRIFIFAIENQRN